MLNATIKFQISTLEGQEKEDYIKSEMEKRIKENSKYHYDIAVELYNTFPFLQEIWSYYPHAHFIKDRFHKKVYSLKIEEDKITISSKEIPPFETPKEDKISALYLVGNTNFNPFTKEEFYWIKVGKTTDLKKRMRGYATHNPMLWKADYKKISNKYLHAHEQICHFILAKYGIQDENSKEWYRVSRETYLTICEQGFAFFEKEELYKRYEILNLI